MRRIPEFSTIRSCLMPEFFFNASTCQVESVLHFSIYPAGGGSSSREEVGSPKNQVISPEEFSDFLLGCYFLLLRSSVASW